jgi:S-adenosylhomocysteine hydrolase
MRTALLIAALFLLVASVAAGATIYFLADDDDASAYVVIGDTAYAVDPATSKTYVRQLERFGGKASVLFDDINRFLASLWHGKRLGLTIGALGAAGALALFLIARRSAP